jgi:glycosyltransferase involved in cell wall biosynthesis
MHIIIFAQYLTSDRGGMEKSIFDITQNLYQRGHKITLIYQYAGNQKHEYEKICSETIKIKHYKLNKNSFDSFLESFTELWSAISRVIAIKSDRNTVIYINYDIFWSFASFLSMCKNLPLVFHVRLPTGEYISKQVLSKKLFSKEKLNVNRTTRFIAISKSVKLDLSNNLGIDKRKVDVVYNGIDPDLFKADDNFDLLRKEWNINKNEKIVSYIGRLNPYKGIDTLIEAFSLLSKSKVNCKLLIAGKSLKPSEKYREYLENLATNSIGNDRVVFLGHISDPISLYRVSDVTVLPSKWPEPFGRTIIESMACGTPVVASNTGGIPEILQAKFSQMLFESGNSQQLSDILNRIIQWRDLDPSLGTKCRNYVIQRFTLQKTVDSVEQTFKKAIENYYKKSIEL